MTTFAHQLTSKHPLSRRQREAIAAYIERLEDGSNERRIGLEEAAFQRGLKAGRLPHCEHECECPTALHHVVRFVIERYDAPIPPPTTEWVIDELRRFLRDEDLGVLFPPSAREIGAVKATAQLAAFRAKHPELVKLWHDEERRATDARLYNPNDVL